MSKYIPSINSVNIDVVRVPGNDKYPYDSVGIYVSAVNNGENVKAAYLVKHDKEDINVFTDIL